MTMGRVVALGVAVAAVSRLVLAAGQPAALIPLKGRADDFLVESLNERLTKVLRTRPKPALVIFELQTRPGPLASALKLADSIHELRDQGISTVGFITGKASASDALLALACARFYLAEGASLAGIEPGAFEDGSSVKARERLLAALERYSAWRPRLAALYRAMVAPSEDVYEMVFEGMEDKPKFVGADEHRRLLASPPKPIVRTERVVRKGKLPRWPAAEAERLGISAGTAKSGASLASHLGADMGKLLVLRGPQERPAPAASKEKKTPRKLTPGPGDKVVFVTLDGMVGDGMAYSLKRRLEEAKALEPAMVIFEINTYGGKLASALEIANRIFDEVEPPTVAYVNNKAISAGALIAVSCDEIVMQKGATLGDCQVVTPSGEAVRSEKIDTVLRARFRTFCEGKYPSALAEAMVTQEIEVFELERLDGQRVYMTRKEYENLMRSPDELAHYKNPTQAKIVVHKDELLTMTHTEALRYGFSRATVTSRRDVLENYGVADRQVVVLGWTWSERFVRLLDAIGPLLLTLGILGILIELKTPGFGIPGIIGLVLIATFFFGKYAAGLAEVWEILLFIVGVGLLAVELFVTPGFGVLGLAGLLLMLASVVLSLQYFIIPETDYEYSVFQRNIVTLGGVVFGVFVGAVLIGKYLHRAPYLGKIILAAPTDSGPTAVATAVSPAPAREQEEKRASELVGRRGRAVTMLRPAGRADFDGEPFDVVTEGDFIQPGEPVEITAVQGNRIIVRRAR